MKGKGLIVLALAGLAVWLWSRRQKTTPSAGQGNVEAYSGVTPRKRRAWNTNSGIGKIYRLDL